MFCSLEKFSCISTCSTELLYVFCWVSCHLSLTVCPAFVFFFFYMPLTLLMFLLHLTQDGSEHTGPFYIINESNYIQHRKNIEGQMRSYRDSVYPPVSSSSRGMSLKSSARHLSRSSPLVPDPPKLPALWYHVTSRSPAPGDLSQETVTV